MLASPGCWPLGKVDYHPTLIWNFCHGSGVLNDWMYWRRLL